MHKLVLALAAALTAALIGAPPAQSATAAGDPVVWAVGDLCSDNLRCAAVADLITADGTADGVALAGDLAYDSGTPAEFTRFHQLFGSKAFPNGRTIRQESYPTPGNHEYRDTSTPCPHYFAYWGSTKAGSCDGQSWRQRVLGNWRVLTLNSNYAGREPVCNAWCEAGVSSTKYAAGLTLAEAEQQRTWLAAQCRNADAAGQGGIVVWHHPALADARYTPGTELGRDLFAVAAANGCEVALVGHTHLYERFTPRNANGVYASTGLTEFVVGSGGAETADQTTTENTAAVQSFRDGALRLVLTPTAAQFEFHAVNGGVVDAGTVPIT